MSLSIREKVLLFVLALVAILYFGMKFLVMPSYGSNQKDKADLQRLAMLKNTALQQVSGTKNANANLQAELKKATGAASSILPEPKNELLNVWIVRLVQRSGLSVTSISFGAATSADISAQSSAQNNVQSSSQPAANQTADYLLKDYANAYNSGVSSSSAASSATSSASNGAKSSSSASSSKGGTSSTASASPGSTSSQAAATKGGLINVGVTVEMAGNYDQAKQFLDDVKNCGKTAVVTSFECKIESGIYKISAVINCYEAVKLDNSDSTFAWDLPKPAGTNDVM
jgi:Tfp pilus assembly protein PilO